MIPFDITTTMHTHQIVTEYLRHPNYTEPINGTISFQPSVLKIDLNAVYHLYEFKGMSTDSRYQRSSDLNSEVEDFLIMLDIFGP